MTYLHPVAAVPNNLITDANLSLHHQAGGLCPAPFGWPEGAVCDRFLCRSGPALQVQHHHRPEGGDRTLHPGLSAQEQPLSF